MAVVPTLFAYLQTTRTELFGVFAQYGFIKSCWLRMGEKGPNKTLAPTYAFVTFSNPADAHKYVRLFSFVFRLTLTILLLLQPLTTFLQCFLNSTTGSFVYKIPVYCIFFLKNKFY